MAHGISRAAGSRLMVAGVGLAALIGLAVVGGAEAQQSKDKAPPKQAPAAKAPAKGAAPAADPKAPQSAWVKLCEKAPVAKVGADGKPVVVDGKPAADEKEICLTHHERLDGNTGMVVVSAALRKVEGQDKEHLMIMVPLGAAIPPGLKAAVYTKDQWAKVAKNEKVETKDLKPVDLKFVLCHQGGCTAEAEATSELISQMKTGGGLMVLALNAGGQPVPFLVPLDGFDASYKGKPIDNKAYASARGELMKQIRARQIELIKQHQEQQKEKSGQAPQTNPFSPPGNAAPAAKPPATASTPPKK
jgi:invasion protein IalB